MEDVYLICYLRPARRKARQVAVMEALCLLSDLKVAAPNGGPLGEQGGIFWLTMPTAGIEHACARLPRLGYTRAVDLLAPMAARPSGRKRGSADTSAHIRWRGNTYERVRVYDEDADALRERAPDRRLFALTTEVGGIRQIRGYRGDGGPLSRRGLPAPDARMLVNLVATARGGLFLDPFGGIGGIVLEALAAERQVVSCDNDPVLRHGLAQLGARHCVADARNLPFRTASIAAIATEPPYDQQAANVVGDGLCEAHRVLVAGGRLSVLCADWQADQLREIAGALRLIPYLDAPLDRKGLATVVLAWQKAA